MDIREFTEKFFTSVNPPNSLEETRSRQTAYGKGSALPKGWGTSPILLGNVPALEISAPEVASKGAVLFFHAGGYSAGSAEDHAGLAGHIGQACGLKSYCVDYRLAPEHVFPAAAEDAFEAYVQLRIKLGNDEPIVLAGDSAGGGLVIVVAQLAKKRGYQGPAALYAISPWISMDLDSPSYKKIGAKDPMLSRQTLGALRELYLNGHPAADEMASPVYGDFADFPPLLIDVGSSEVLLGDAIELSRLTAMEGNTVSLNVWKDMIHIFPWFYPHLLEANQAIQQAGEWLRKTIGK